MPMVELWGWSFQCQEIVLLGIPWEVANGSGHCWLCYYLYIYLTDGC